MTLNGAVTRPRILRILLMARMTAIGRNVAVSLNNTWSAVDPIGEKTMTDKKTTFILISKIAKRALADVFQPQRVNVQLIDICMDIENCHKVCPLRLQDLLDADAGNFGHDIAGIYQHFNRQTLELENCFTPRFAA